MSIETDFESQHISAMLKRIQKIDAIYDYASKDIADRLVRNTLKYGQQGTSFFRWNRKTEEQIDVILESLRNGVYENIRTGTADAWDIANAKNDLLIKSYLGDMKVPGEIYATMHQSNVLALNAFLDRTVNGLKVSDRVWDLAKVGKNQMELALSAGIAEGRSARALATDIKQSLKEPNRLFRRVRDKNGKLVLSQAAQRYHPGRGVYRSSFQNALRLAANEMNTSYRQSDQERRSQIPFVVGFEVHLSNSHPSPDICDSMAGRYPKSFVWTAWHPRCICYTTSVLASKEEFKQYLRTGELKTNRAVKTIPVKAEKYVKEKGPIIQGWSSQPEWMQNFTQDLSVKQSVINLENIVKEPEFVPAKTIQEAESFILTNIAKNVGFKNGGAIKLNDINVINQYLYETIKKYKLEKLDFIGWQSEKGKAIKATAFYQKRTVGAINGKAIVERNLCFNKSQLMKWEENHKFIAKRQLELFNLKKTTSKFYTVDNLSLDATARHEIAHYLYDINKEIKTKFTALIKQFTGGTTEGWRNYFKLCREVSEYAASDSTELFAELHAAIMRGEETRLPKELVKIYKESLGE